MGAIRGCATAFFQVFQWLVPMDRIDGTDR